MRWAVTVQALLTDPTTNAGRSGSLYRGRWPDQRLAGTIDGIPQNHEQPHEPMADGCSAGWIRTPYMESVVPYMRRRTEGGGRVENPRFTGADEHIQAAVLYLEDEQERWHAHREMVRAKYAERDRKKREAKRGHR